MRRDAAAGVGEGRNSAYGEPSRRRAWGAWVAGGCCWAALANWEGWQNPKG